MSFLNWTTEDRLKKIEADLREALDDTEMQIGSPAAMQKVAQSVLDLIEALRKEPGPHINHGA